MLNTVDLFESENTNPAFLYALCATHVGKQNVCDYYATVIKFLFLLIILIHCFATHYWILYSPLQPAIFLDIFVT